MTNIIRYLFPLYDYWRNPIVFSRETESTYIRLFSLDVLYPVYLGLKSEFGSDLDNFSYGIVYVKISKTPTGVLQSDFFLKQQGKYINVSVSSNTLIINNNVHISTYDIRLVRFFQHGLFIDKSIRLYPISIRTYANRYLVETQSDTLNEHVYKYYTENYFKHRGDVMVFKLNTGDIMIYIYTGERSIKVTCNGSLVMLPEEFTTYEFSVYHFKGVFCNIVHIDIAKQKDLILKSYKKYYPYSIINKFGDRIYTTKEFIAKIRNSESGILSLYISQK